MLTPELLHYSFGWEHRLRSDGASSIGFTLADGRAIDGAAIRGVLNRISFVPAHLLQHLVAADRIYAQQEWTALHISWLSSLHAPVLNLPVIEGLCGAWRHRSEWAWLAGQAGLDAGNYLQGASAQSAGVSGTAAGAATHDLRSVIAIDGRGIGSYVGEDVADACGRLGVLAKTRLLGVDLDAHTGAFLSASPLPDLRSGGEQIIDALASALRAAA
ncbi:MAG: hypothetical protein ABIS06_06630 [Vicinamibacterales bacterium]